MIIDFSTPITIVEEDFKAIKPSCLHACYLFLEVTINWGAKVIAPSRTERIGRKNFPTSLQQRNLWEIFLLKSCSSESRRILVPKALDIQSTSIYNLENNHFFFWKTSEITPKMVIKNKSRNNNPFYFTLTWLRQASQDTYNKPLLKEMSKYKCLDNYNCVFREFW